MSEKTNENQGNFTSIRKQFMRYLSATDNVPALSEQFGALDSNFERVNFVSELLKSSKIDINFRNDHKSDDAAAKLREKGNEMFKGRKLKEAWEFYTRSIAHATEDGVNLSLAFANRSAVLFEANLHKYCLMDIEQALCHNYPDHLKPKLFLRERKSRNLDAALFKNTHTDVPTLLDQNPKIQCASSSLKIQEDEEFGRFVVAAKDIKAGEILAIEQPFTLFVVNHILSHCHECICLCYSLIPCKSCTNAMYCSVSCREKAFQRYHKYECPVLATIKFLELDKLKILPLKIAFLVKNEYSNIENLVPNLDEIYQSDRYKEIHNLITNTSKRSVSDLFERATVAAVLFHLVKNQTDFFADANQEQEDMFKDILLLHMQTGPSNFHEITELARNSTGIYELEEIGGGAFAFLSLLNHSCSPNVTRFCYGSSIVLRAIENIEEGEQCFDNYGYHHAVMKKFDRRKHLQDQYHFNCTCQACVQDWPLYDDLPKVGDVEIFESFSKVSTDDVEVAEEVLQETLPKLEELQKLQPCQNFCQAQEVVKQCFAIFGNKRRIF